MQRFIVLLLLGLSPLLLNVEVVALDFDFFCCFYNHSESFCKSNKTLFEG